jgi:hypothetical protein
MMAMPPRCLLRALPGRIIDVALTNTPTYLAPLPPPVTAGPTTKMFCTGGSR